MGWTFIFLMLVLKIPIAGLLWIVWWAIKQTPEPDASGDGGTRRPVVPHPPHPRDRRPRRPRPRGPHGARVLPAPPRVRTSAVARRRTTGPHRL